MLSLPGYGANEDMRSDAIKGIAGDTPPKPVELGGVSASEYVDQSSAMLIFTQGCYLTLVITPTEEKTREVALDLLS